MVGLRGPRADAPLPLRRSVVSQLPVFEMRNTEGRGLGAKSSSMLSSRSLSMLFLRNLVTTSQSEHALVGLGRSTLLWMLVLTVDANCQKWSARVELAGTSRPRLIRQVKHPRRGSPSALGAGLSLLTSATAGGRGAGTAPARRGAEQRWAEVAEDVWVAVLLVDGQEGGRGGRVRGRDGGGRGRGVGRRLALGAKGGRLVLYGLLHPPACGDGLGGVEGGLLVLLADQLGGSRGCRGGQHRVEGDVVLLARLDELLGRRRIEQQRHYRCVRSLLPVPVVLSGVHDGEGVPLLDHQLAEEHRQALADLEGRLVSHCVQRLRQGVQKRPTHHGRHRRRQRLTHGPPHEGVVGHRGEFRERFQRCNGRRRREHV
mmetsp:Transcript_34119/g.98263  ORF Transcript_34119/g.98263 Transcript_34119/m.98263 type:complete len:372 (+) Transcript_34119:559-1674(+)